MGTEPTLYFDDSVAIELADVQFVWRNLTPCESGLTEYGSGIEIQVPCNFRRFFACKLRGMLRYS